VGKVLYTVGDSFVFRGTQHTTWSSFLSDKLNYVDANNGMSGTSNDRNYRSVIRDVSRVETEGKLWTETTGDINCQLDDLFIIVGWTSPFRFEWFKDGEYFSSRIWENSEFKNKNNSQIDFIFDNKISEPLSDEVNSLIRFFNQIISLKSFLNDKKIKNIFYNCFFPVEENTVKYFEDKIEEIENNKPKEFIGHDNPSTYYSLTTLWKQVPDDYKKYNQLEYIRIDNVDETLHPTKEGNKLWADRLYELILL
jgi:hypothetical protein